MARGPSAIYRAQFLDWVVELRIADVVYGRAHDSRDLMQGHYWKQIIRQFKAACANKYGGRKPGYIEWSRLVLTKLPGREIPQQAVLPPRTRQAQMGESQPTLF